MTQTTHPPEEMLQLYSDGTLDAKASAAITVHLDACQRCAGRLRELALLGRAVRDLPLQRADDRLTRAVMARIAADPASNRFFRILLYAPPVLGLCAVLSIMVGAFFLSGTLDSDITSPVTQSLGGAVQVLGSWADKEGNALAAKIGGLVSFLPGGRTLVLLAATCLILGVITVFDRTVGRKVLQRVR